MTKDELFKLIAEVTTGFGREQVLRDAVDAYTSALLQQCNVSLSLPLAELFDGLKLIEANCDNQDNRFEQIWRIAYSLLCKYDKSFRDYSGNAS